MAVCHHFCGVNMYIQFSWVSFKYFELGDPLFGFYYYFVYFALCEFIVQYCFVNPCGWINFYRDFHLRLPCIYIFTRFCFCFFNNTYTENIVLGKYKFIV